MGNSSSGPSTKFPDSKMDRLSPVLQTYAFSASVTGRRDANEDYHKIGVLDTEFFPYIQLFATFDGHGGNTISSFSSKSLAKHITAQMLIACRQMEMTFGGFDAHFETMMKERSRKDKNKQPGVFSCGGDVNYDDSDQQRMQQEYNEHSVNQPDYYNNLYNKTQPEPSMPSIFKDRKAMMDEEDDDYDDGKQNIDNRHKTYKMPQGNNETGNSGEVNEYDGPSCTPPRSVTNPCPRQPINMPLHTNFKRYQERTVLPQPQTAPFATKQTPLTNDHILFSSRVLAPRQLPTWLHKSIFWHTRFDILRTQAIHNAVMEAFVAFDMEILEKYNHIASHSGSTAVIILLDTLHGTCFTANVGDSRAVLGRNGTAVPLSMMHAPMLPMERERIQEQGCSLGQNRLNSSLAISRALGDTQYKKFTVPHAHVHTPQLEKESDPKFKKDVDQKITDNKDITPQQLRQHKMKKDQEMLTNLLGLQHNYHMCRPWKNACSPIPYTMSTQVSSLAKDHFIVMGCDGLFDCLPEQTIVDWIYARFRHVAVRALCNAHCYSYNTITARFLDSLYRARVTSFVEYKERFISLHENGVLNNYPHLEAITRKNVNTESAVSSYNYHNHSDFFVTPSIQKPPASTTPTNTSTKQNPDCDTSDNIHSNNHTITRSSNHHTRTKTQSQLASQQQFAPSPQILMASFPPPPNKSTYPKQIKLPYHIMGFYNPLYHLNQFQEHAVELFNQKQNQILAEHGLSTPHHAAEQQLLQQRNNGIGYDKRAGNRYVPTTGRKGRGGNARKDEYQCLQIDENPQILLAARQCVCCQQDLMKRNVFSLLDKQRHIKNREDQSMSHNIQMLIQRFKHFQPALAAVYYDYYHTKHTNHNDNQFSDSDHDTHLKPGDQDHSHRQSTSSFNRVPKQLAHHSHDGHSVGDGVESTGSNLQFFDDYEPQLEHYYIKGAPINAIGGLAFNPVQTTPFRHQNDTQQQSREALMDFYNSMTSQKMRQDPNFICQNCDYINGLPLLPAVFPPGHVSAYLLPQYNLDTNSTYDLLSEQQNMLLSNSQHLALLPRNETMGAKSRDVEHHNESSIAQLPQKKRPFGGHKISDPALIRNSNVDRDSDGTVLAQRQPSSRSSLPAINPVNIPTPLALATVDRDLYYLLDGDDQHAARLPLDLFVPKISTINNNHNFEITSEHDQRIIKIPYRVHNAQIRNRSVQYPLLHIPQRHLYTQDPISTSLQIQEELSNQYDRFIQHLDKHQQQSPNNNSNGTNLPTPSNRSGGGRSSRQLPSTTLSTGPMKASRASRNSPQSIQQIHYDPISSYLPPILTQLSTTLLITKQNVSIVNPAPQFRVTTAPTNAFQSQSTYADLLSPLPTDEPVIMTTEYSPTSPQNPNILRTAVLFVLTTALSPTSLHSSPVSPLDMFLSPILALSSRSTEGSQLTKPAHFEKNTLVGSNIAVDNIALKPFPILSYSFPDDNYPRQSLYADISDIAMVTTSSNEDKTRSALHIYAICGVSSPSVPSTLPSTPTQTPVQNITTPISSVDFYTPIVIQNVQHHINLVMDYSTMCHSLSDCDINSDANNNQISRLYDNVFIFCDISAPTWATNYPHVCFVPHETISLLQPHISSTLSQYPIFFEVDISPRITTNSLEWVSTHPTVVEPSQINQVRLTVHSWMINKIHPHASEYLIHQFQLHQYIWLSIFVSQLFFQQSQNQHTTCFQNLITTTTPLEICQRPTPKPLPNVTDTIGYTTELDLASYCLFTPTYHPFHHHHVMEPSTLAAKPVADQPNSDDPAPHEDPQQPGAQQSEQQETPHPTVEQPEDMNRRNIKAHHNHYGNSLHNICYELVELALAAGSRDNISAIIVFFRFPLLEDVVYSLVDDNGTIDQEYFNSRNYRPYPKFNLPIEREVGERQDDEDDDDDNDDDNDDGNEQTTDIQIEVE